jgi:hypothetical protein
LLGLIVAVPAVQAQHLPHQVRPAMLEAAPGAALDSLAYRGDTGGAVLGALVLGGLGLMAGWYTGDAEVALWAEAIGVGLGAHVGNGGRGNALATLLTSIGVLFAGRLLADHLDLGDAAALYIPMVQIALTVAVETATTPPGAPRRRQRS